MKNRVLSISLLLLSLGCFYFGWSIRHAPEIHAQAGQNGSQYIYINSAGTTAVRTGAGGYLNSVSINGGTGGVVSLFDIESAGCTGTPASGKFAAIASTTAPVTLFYDIYLRKGLCVVTAAATDVTVSYN